MERLAALNQQSASSSSPQRYKYIKVAQPQEKPNASQREDDFKVIRKLGRGESGVVLLVERRGQTSVLKVASRPDCNGRIKREFLLLRRLNWPQIVRPIDFHEFGFKSFTASNFKIMRIVSATNFRDLHGFTMENAGDVTLAQHLRRNGPLDLTTVKQFGEDLLRSIQYLNEEGIGHRDVKPGNIGVRMGKTKERKELCLFDFSLFSISPDNIGAGSPPYLDPFIRERKVKRWDIKSELFSAAMTLHEMATGVLPKWGDGKTKISLTKGEVNIVGELFPTELRGRFAEFFEKALRRNFAERYDNPAEMLRAWTGLFETIDEPVRKTTTLTTHYGRAVVRTRGENHKAHLAIGCGHDVERRGGPGFRLLQPVLKLADEIWQA
jgi:serine/threonine protein kinase